MLMNNSLLRDRRFWPIFWTQFLGAFNDNVFKNALVILITLRAFSIRGVSSEQIVALCGGIFILPFFLFSATAGQLADKYSKSRIVVWIKVWEILAMLIGAYGFITERFLLLLTTLFFMGLHSTFFGPVKYSILPQLLRQEELVSGTAYVEMGTFIAILLGTLLGGFLISLAASGPWLVSVAALSVAILGWITSTRIRSLAPVAPFLQIPANPIGPTIQMVKLTAKVRSVFLSILGISWFWFFGAAVLSLLPGYCKHLLNGEEGVITLFLAMFSVGVGVGSMLCGRLSAQKLELGLVPVGSLGLSLFAFDLFLIGRPSWLPIHPEVQLTITHLLATVGGWRITMDLFLLAVFGGFFIVPLYTLVQQRSAETERSRVIAGNNIINAFSMVVAAALLVLLFALKFTIPQIFLLLAVLNLAVAVYIYTVLPEFLFRFLCWVSAHVLYRLRVVGREHLPLDGPAVLVCNHVSLVDWLIIASACPRPVRFVMHYSFLQIPFTRRIFKDAKVIPLAGSREKPEILESAFARIAQELEDGELVCIFPEGRITPDGSLQKFRPGVERVLARTPAPVIPMALSGLWGSFFSKKHGKPMRRPCRRICSRISLVIGPAVSPPEATAEKLQELVGDLASRGAQDAAVSAAAPQSGR
jgi:1-acyl-sn-glycerol-3-phosphate acyltransferase